MVQWTSFQYGSRPIIFGSYLWQICTYAGSPGCSKKYQLDMSNLKQIRMTFKQVVLQPSNCDLDSKFTKSSSQCYVFTQFNNLHNIQELCMEIMYAINIWRIIKLSVQFHHLQFYHIALYWTLHPPFHLRSERALGSTFIFNHFQSVFMSKAFQILLSEGGFFTFEINVFPRYPQTQRTFKRVIIFIF